MTVISSESLIDFVNFQLTKSTSCLKYAAGAIFEGTIDDNRPSGYGKFTWPNNEFFEGFFLNGLRIKIGFQKWPDGDMYKGEFYNDKRHGWGIYKWANDDKYEGSFYRDSRHGFGIYWANNNNRYSGTFYMNKREGFGTFVYANGDIFQGLYKDNYRCGPGILRYADGRNDIGLWHRSSLLKLIVQKPDVFSIQQFSDLISLYSNNNSELPSHSSEAMGNSVTTYYPHDSILQYKLSKPSDISLLENNIGDETSLKPGSPEYSEGEESSGSLERKSEINPDNENDEIDDINSQRSSLKEDQSVEISIQSAIDKLEEEHITDPHLDELRKEFIQFDTDFPEFFTNLKRPNNIVSLMEKFLLHLTRFSTTVPAKTDPVEVIDMPTVVKDVISNIFSISESAVQIDRQLKYGPPGDFELRSELLLSLSHFGNLKELKKLLMDPIAIDVNVTDCRGSFSLLEATLTWNIGLINYLLNCGANINHVTDEGISPLGACMLLYYPQKDFMEVIAEGVVQLNQTPLNFNGVRREPTKKPNLTESIDVIKSSNEKFTESKSVKVLNIEENENDNEWNNYQDSLVGLDIVNNGYSQSETVIKILEHKITDDNSTKFGSLRNCIEYPTNVNESLLDKAATALSMNSMIINRQKRPNSCYQEVSKNEGTARFRALKISRCNEMMEVIHLLLQRGADPNICRVPFTALFFAVKCGDIEMTKLLISKGADLNATLIPENGSLALLHIAVCLPGKCGIKITKLLLESGAKPNVRALEDDSFLDKTLMDEWSKDTLSDEQMALIGGKTPLHLACSRYDDFKVSHTIAKLLLDFGADPNLLCNGHTALTLAITSGNDLIVDEILNNDKLLINLPLTHGLGNVLCVATSTAFEHTRTPDSRLNLIKKLIASKADILAPVSIGIKRSPGIAIDYAYHVFNLDQRVAHLPYHALTSIERDLFNNRRAMLSHVGMFTRESAVEKEKQRLEEMKRLGKNERSPSPNFIYTGASGVPPSAVSKSSRHLTNIGNQMEGTELLARKPILKYCYECGRSVNVKLTACTRCKEVYFCSKLCKTKAWTSRHKYECLRVGTRISSAESDHRIDRQIDSPTPATIGEDAKIAKGISKSQMSQVLVKIDPSKLKEKLQKEYSQRNGSGKLHSQLRRLPPLNYQNHPAYSYAYIMGQYVKIDSLGRLLPIEHNLLDNYSFE